MRYEKEIAELKEQKQQIQQRIKEVRAEIKAKYNHDGWGTTNNKRLGALKGNLAGVNEALNYLIRYQRKDEERET